MSLYHLNSSSKCLHSKRVVVYKPGYRIWLSSPINRIRKVSNFLNLLGYDRFMTQYVVQLNPHSLFTRCKGAEEILERATLPVSVIPSAVGKLQFGDKERMVGDQCELKLLKTYDDRYLLGNAVSDGTFCDVLILKLTRTVIYHWRRQSYFFYRTFFLKQGINSQYVIVYLICLGLYNLLGL